MTVASDILKLIGYIKVMNGKLDLRSYFLRAPTSMPTLCLDLFTHFVVNESGTVHVDAIKFFKECLLNLLSEDEKDGFVCKIIDTFLSRPINHIS